jgi:formyl-CoA transferase
MGDVTHTESVSIGRPLEGVRILAVEQMQSLPFATQILARLGADVVKVEHPIRGDLGRSSLPSIRDKSGNQMGATFIRNNLSKKSIGIDLKHEQGQELFRRLMLNFDVIAENFKPGTMERFGLDYATLALTHKEMIYLSISGFGNTTDSPYQKWPAFAPIAEAMSGMYTFNRQAHEEIKVSPVGALGDTGTGLFAVIGILAAIRHRETTGYGQYIDLSMFDSMIAFADIVPNYFSMGHDPRSPSLLINHGFKISNGELVIQIGREHQFEHFVKLIGHSDWLDDERFSSRQGWLDNIDIIREAVQTWGGNKTTLEACTLLAEVGVAAAPVFEAKNLVDDKHISGRNMLIKIPTIDGDTVLVAGNPIKMSKLADGGDTPPPTLGEHTEEVLIGELSLTQSEYAQLQSDGVIA